MKEKSIWRVILWSCVLLGNLVSYFWLRRYSEQTSLLVLCLENRGYLAMLVFNLPMAHSMGELEQCALTFCLQSFSVKQSIWQHFCSKISVKNKAVLRASVLE